MTATRQDDIESMALQLREIASAPARDDHQRRMRTGVFYGFSACTHPSDDVDAHHDYIQMYRENRHDDVWREGYARGAGLFLALFSE